MSKNKKSFVVCGMHLTQRVELYNNNYNDIEGLHHSCWISHVCNNYNTAVKVSKYLNNKARDLSIGYDSSLSQFTHSSKLNDMRKYDPMIIGQGYYRVCYLGGVFPKTLDIPKEWIIEDIIK